MNFVIIGNPENRRLLSFCASVHQLGYGGTTVIPYIDWLLNKPVPVLPANSILKIDSPGENAIVKRMLVALGAGKTDTGPAAAQGSQAPQESFGEIGYTVPWYKGYCHLLDDIQFFARQYLSVQLMNAPADIKLMFDKVRCQHYLRDRAITVPFSLPPVSCYEELIAAMHEHNLSKVFIKPAHGSSASGVIAFRRTGNKVQVVTPVEMIRDGDRIRLYNSLTIRTYTREKEAAALIGQIMAENVLVEEWIPKATLKNHFFDIRVLVIAGKARHTVFRMSKHIITNLHLGNKRGDMKECRQLIGEQKFREIQLLAERTAACFPDSLYMGIDILLSADWRDIAVLEVNAFGDLLPGLVDAGETCYEAQIQAMIQKQRGRVC